MGVVPMFASHTAAGEGDPERRWRPEWAGTAQTLLAWPSAGPGEACQLPLSHAGSGFPQGCPPKTGLSCCLDSQCVFVLVSHF